jgi:murein L,D-transpeptidase YcbB/YkuD
MSDDFGFEFVDEETQESPVEPRPRPPRVFADSGSAANADDGRSAVVARRRRWVIGAIVAVVVLILVVVLTTGGSSGRAGAYRSYFSRLTPLAAGSERVGTSLSRILGQVQHAQISDPTSKLEPLVKQARAQLAAVQALEPPTALRTAQSQAVSAFAFRLAGLAGLKATLAHASGSKRDAVTTELTGEMARLVASDVVWRDLFLQSAATGLRQARLAPSLAPPSVFVANTNLSSPQTLAGLAHPQAPASTPVLRLGSTGAAVKGWQQQLNRWLRLKHLTAITADGAFGAGTQAATESLQRAAAVTADGVVGPATRRALTTALASPG